MSKSDLERFKEHCSAVLRECGLRPIEKLDKSDGLPEINEDLFPKVLTQEERTAILYEGVDKPWYDKQQYYRPVPIQNCGNTTTVNVILPPGTQGTLFQGKNGQPCLTFKPSLYYGQFPCGKIPQNNAFYSGNTATGYTMSELPGYSSDWYDQEPKWTKNHQSGDSEVDGHGFVREDADDDYNRFDGYDDYGDDDDYQETVQISPDNKPLDRGAMIDIPEEKIDPFKIYKRLPIEIGEGGKIIPFVCLKEIKK